MFFSRKCHLSCCYFMLCSCVLVFTYITCHMHICIHDNYILLCIIVVLYICRCCPSSYPTMYISWQLQLSIKSINCSALPNTAVILSLLHKHAGICIWKFSIFKDSECELLVQSVDILYLLQFLHCTYSNYMAPALTERNNLYRLF